MPGHVYISDFGTKMVLTLKQAQCSQINECLAAYFHALPTLPHMANHSAQQGMTYATV